MSTMTNERLAELRLWAERVRYADGAEAGPDLVIEACDAVEALQAELEAARIREELNVPLLEARSERDAAIQRAEKAERERDRYLADANEYALQIHDLRSRLAACVAKVERIRQITTCAGPYEGGCIPSDGCVHEFAKSALAAAKGSA